MAAHAAKICQLEKMTPPPTTTTFHHLTWKEARIKLRHTVESHLENRPSKYYCRQCRREKIKWQFLEHFDLVLAFSASVVLFVLALLSYLERIAVFIGKLSPDAAAYVYISDIVGSILAVLAALTSLLVVWARRRASGCNRHVGVRRALRSISSYLKRCEDNYETSVALLASGTSSPERDKNTEENSNRINLSSGTTLTDIYPVYRSNHWHQVPSLLLVEGDVIAMQVGDTSPALSEEIPLPSERHPSQQSAPVVVQAGERITLETYHVSQVPQLDKKQGINDEGCIPTLPKGKLIRDPDSKDLLQLCNDMRIFHLQETPLTRFLDITYLEHRQPQIHRQAKSIRRFLLIVGGIVFTLTVVLLFVRQDTASADLSLILPIPLIAVISVLPMIMPTQLTFLEAIGTARILSTVHPWASCTSGNADDSGELPERRGGLFVRYCLEVLRSRLLPEETVFESGSSSCITRVLRWIFSKILPASLDLIPAPPVNTCLLEKLGVATALCLIDDDLACEQQSTPQQLLIPSSHGLKLLDLCPSFEDEAEIDSDDADASNLRLRKHTNSLNSSLASDSDSDDEHPRTMGQTQPSLRTTPLYKLRRKWRKATHARVESIRNAPSRSDISDAGKRDNGVQFEDPNWWQFLPSLKCIGLACLLGDGDGVSCLHPHQGDGNARREKSSFNSAPYDSCVLSLVRHIGVFPRRAQLQSLAHCIGFNAKPNSHGARGDLTPFTEANRFYVVSSRLLSKRLALDRHALGLEDARRWGYLNRDAVCIVIQDHRSKGYQLLTVGSPSVVTELCSDSWHGEKSTISPLSSIDRKSILDTSNNWCLSDLDVFAFSYAPVPYTLEQRIIGRAALSTSVHKSAALPAVHENPAFSTAYLLDNRSLADLDAPISKDSGGAEWSLVNNQIFLGMLGSLVSPREEIDYILGQLTTAGVRFVYFSPRNMRRTKELASQMGIDVAWNCAISLRPLDKGQEDPHRMISSYADWDVNARLPHGIADVKRHLREVDNVPLLVSLFTDATEDSTMDMINIFREYHDTVVAVGLSHLSSNEGPFSAADIAIGVDMLMPCAVASGECGLSSNASINQSHKPTKQSSRRNMACVTDITEPFLHYEEVEFVSSIAAHNCVFNLKGPSTMEHLPDFIVVGRAALDATSSGALFVLNAGLSLAFLSLLCPCTVSTCIPYIPTLGSALYLLVIIPLLGLSMSWTDAQSESMSEIPPKNDESAVFGRGDGKRLYAHILIRALLPAMGSQLLYLIALGELLLEFEPDYLEVNCAEMRTNWIHVIRCPSLRFYSGNVRIWSGTLMLGQMALSVIVASAGFVYRTRSLREEPPWSRNAIWCYTTLASLAFMVVYIVLAIDGGAAAARVARTLPLYYYTLSILFPPTWVVVGEIVKKVDRQHEKRACMLRRLQFETRLGMWSPK